MFVWIVSLSLTALAGVVNAQEKTDVEALYKVLRIDEMLDILREEGVGSSSEMAESFFGGTVPRGWTRDVEALYRPDVIRSDFKAIFVNELGAADLAQLLEFFQSDLGHKIVELEL